MVITSVNNNRIKELVKLKDKKYRDKVGLFYIEGEDIIKEAYNEKIIKDLYLLEGMPKLDGVNTYYVSLEVMKKISDMGSVSGYYAVCYKLDKYDIGKRILILDGIQDPGNLGTIIRCMVAFNFDTLVLSRDTVDIYNSKVIRSAKGMLFKISVIVSDIDDFVGKLNDYAIYGTDVNDGVDVRHEEINGHVAIIIGNEGQGIRSNVRKLCHKFINLKINDECESLNAGVCAGIIMYEVDKKC